MRIWAKPQSVLRLVLFLVLTLQEGAKVSVATQPSPPVTAPEDQGPNFPSLDQASPLLEQPLRWNTVLGQLSAPSGWKVEVCEGGSAALCVDSDQGYAGSVELLTYPLEQMPRFRGDLATSADGGFSALEALVKDFYQTLEKDRKSGLAEVGYQFSALTPERVAVGNLAGLHYGFSGFAEDGRLLERSVNYATFDREAVYIIHAQAVPPRPGGQWIERHGEFVDEDLRRFEPYLAEIVKQLRFPGSRR